MGEKAGSVGGGEVSGFGKYLFEFFVGEHSGLFQTIHGTSYFHVDVAVGGYQVIEIVLVNDLLGDVGEFHSHVFVSIEWGIEIHVTDVHCHVLGTWSGNDTVDVNFECFKARGFSADISGVVQNEVAAASDAGPVGLFFLGADGTDNSGVGDCAARWYLRFCDEDECVGAIYFVPKALGKASEFVGTGLVPVFLVVGVSNEMSVFHLFPCDVVGNGKGVVFEL